MVDYTKDDFVQVFKDKPFDAVIETLGGNQPFSISSLYPDPWFVFLSCLRSGKLKKFLHPDHPILPDSLGVTDLCSAVAQPPTLKTPSSDSTAESVICKWRSAFWLSAALLCLC